MITMPPMQPVSSWVQITVNGADLVDGSITIDALLPEIIPEGSRNATLSQKVSKLIKRYGTTAEAHALFMDEAAKCVPPLEKNELNSIWRSACGFGERISKEPGYIPPEQYNPPAKLTSFLSKVDMANNRRYPWTDIGAGRLFADCFADRARYVPARKSWYCYKDGVWSPDVGGMQVMEYCKQLADALLCYALSIRDEQRQAFLRYCEKWQNRHMREVILKDAQSEHTVDMKEFDTDPYIFNCRNGTLHLDSMAFTEHRPEDLLTKKSNVTYNPEARCDRFLSFMDEICSGDQAKAKFIQKALGYGISGDTQYECLFVLHGATTRNGKGTLCESVLKVLGDYGCSARPETLGVKKLNNSQNPSEDIARLAGVRFVNISEPGKGLVLDAAQVKTMTGNDTLNARFLHENSFDFRPQFKLFINTNYLPVINDMTLFSSNRIIIIPFDRHFEENEQDKTLKAEFAKPENQSAILNWLLEGYRLVQKDGLGQPESVRSATAEYHQDSDKIKQFIEETLEAAPSQEIKTAVVYEKYRIWCRLNGCYAENSRNFNQALRGVATLVRKRPKEGGGATTLLVGYTLSGTAKAL